MPVNSSAISSLGVGSGLDLGSLLDQIKSSEQARLQPLQLKQRSFQTKLSAYGKIQGALDNLQDASDALGKASLYHGTKATTAAKAFSAHSSSEAVAGNYRVRVTQLAQAQSLASAGVAATDTQIGAGGTLTLSLGDGNGNTTKSVDVTLADGDSTLGGIRDAINKADIGINASIINDGSAATPYRLVLSSAASGSDSQISVAASDAAGGGTALSDLLDYDSATASGNLDQTVAAQNAELSVNGIAITSQSNTVKDAIQGVSLSLNATNTSAERLATKPDDGAVKGAISTFVKAYNKLAGVSDQLTAFNGADSRSGVLLGDSTVRSVESRLRGALNTAVGGGAFSGLAQIGVSLQKDGTLAIDDDRLDTVLADNRDDVTALLAGDAGDDSSNGVAGVLSDTITRLGGEHGLVKAATDGTQRSIDNVGDRIDRLQDTIDASIERQRKEFVALDAAVAKFNSTQSYLTTQLNKLNGGSDNGGGGLF